MAPSANHDDARVVILVGALEGGTERGELFPVEAVLDMGSVQPDRGDAIADLVLDGALSGRLLLNGHRSPPSYDVKLNSDHIF